MKVIWIQLTDALPELWKDGILNCRENSMDLCIFDHHLIKKQFILLKKVWKKRTASNTNFLKIQKNNFIDVLERIFQQF